MARWTAAALTGNSLSFTFDALGRNLTQAGPHGTITPTWDLAGDRTRIAHPDSNYWDYDHLVTGELSAVRENGATSGVGVLATYNYDTSSNAGQLGIATGITFGNGASTSYAYDAVQRLTTLGHDISGTTYDQSLGFSYNPASQITQNTRSNDLYAWNGHYNVNRNYTANGLNQYTASGSVTPTYDGKGNLTSAGSTTYAYSSENLLKTATGSITLSYDPALRLYETAGGAAGTTRRQYDGVDLVAEYNGSGTVLRRFVHGAGTDVPIAWYEGTGLTTRRFLQVDERGSVTAVTDGAGAIVGTNSYDEYGIPSSTNLGRFQYTGQTWLPELGMYYYKARLFSPTLGRFLQPDPIGLGGGMNVYAYVAGDPINKTDPLGLKQRDRVRIYHDGSGGGGGGGGPGVVESLYEQTVIINGWPAPFYTSAAHALAMSDVRYGKTDRVERGVPPPRDYCTGVPDSPNDVYQGAACAVHDRCYASSTPRKECDKEFFYNIYEECVNQSQNKVGCFAQAKLYHIGVRAFGWLFYRPQKD